MQVLKLEIGHKFEEIVTNLQPKFSFRLANKLKSYVGGKFEEIVTLFSKTDLFMQVFNLEKSFQTEN